MLKITQSQKSSKRALPVWKDNQLENARLVLEVSAQDLSWSEKLVKLCLFGNGAGLVSCFTAMGSGWDRPGFVQAITAIFPWFLASLLFAAFALVAVSMTASIIGLLKSTVAREGWRSSAKSHFNMYRVSAIASFLLVLMSFVTFSFTVFWSGQFMADKNFAVQSGVEVSSSAIKDGNVSLIVVNTGGRIARLTRVTMHVTNPNDNSQRSSLTMSLPNGENPFIGSNEQRLFTIPLNTTPVKLLSRSFREAIASG
jgi:hypothetical protein